MARVLRSALDAEREAQAAAADAADREADAALWRRIHTLHTGELEHPAVAAAEADLAPTPLMRAAVAAVFAAALAASYVWPWWFAPGVTQ